MLIKKLLSYFYPFKIKSIPSPLNGMFDVTWENGKKVLNTKDANYSYGSLHTIFQRALKEIKFGNKPLKNVLILGFGAGSIYKIIRKEYHLDVDIVGVEKDPTYKEIIPLFLENLTNCNLVYGDAIDFMERNEGKFDLILCDLFVNNEVLSQTMDYSFIRNIKKSLTVNGYYIHNTMMPSKTEERDYFMALEQSFNEVDLKVYQYINSVFFCK